MHWIAQLIFLAVLGTASYFFYRNVSRIRRNILLGRDEDRSDQKSLRWKTMLRVAFGQSKMAARPIPFILHFVVYAGFLLINIEVLEIIIDGIFGTHRVLSFMGPLYDIAIGFFEILAIGVLIACALFLARRFIARIPRFHKAEMKGWPTRDATIILVSEIVLMTALLLMNGADQALQQIGNNHYIAAGYFPVSGLFSDAMLHGCSENTLILIERSCWWFHILGILLFLNFLPYSKHFHIILAFPNTYYSNLNPKGRFTNISSVTNEVKMMLGLPDADTNAPPPESFGAKDVQDLTWKNLMDAYTCTECGRCTSVCPANLTGKALSPRKIMMDTRDRLEEVGNLLDKKQEITPDKNLHSYISKEELWACTTCNACAEACPVNIDPLNIIVQMRQYLVMEKSEAPNELNMMFSNVENNGAPWQFPASDRDAWTR
ncbi:MAG: 4Fe-4S dicluster domain-containing protein [Bacteroidetes bacterium]|nr:4Fe-4S dicluster domain-containing protein [Bacteroidota bacterium]